MLSDAAGPASASPARPRRRCPACNRIVAAAARFCSACGATLEPGAAPPRTARDAGGRAGKMVLDELKLVTILFADVVDSVSVIRGVDPEDADALLGPALASMSAAVNKFGGLVRRTLGDSVMAIFGAPTAQEDHAARACYAALDMLRRRADFASPATDSIQIRVGIHSGQVAVGTSHNDFADEFDAAGLTVSIAARVQAAAPPGGAAITAATRALVGDVVGAEPIGAHALRGLPGPVELFLLAPLPAASSAQTAAPAPFVGRGALLRSLEAEFRTARGGRFRTLFVTGEAGFGKTSLATAFCRRHATDAIIGRGAAERYGEDRPLHPIRDLVLRLFGLDHASLDDRNDWVGAQAAIEPGPYASLEGPLRDLLDVGGLDAGWEALDPRQKFRSTVDCVRTLLRRRSAAKPLILVVEDLQRADSATIDLLGALSESSADLPALLIVTSRPESEPAWADSEAVRRVRLAPMDRRGMVDLATHLLGRPAPPMLERLLLAWSEGSPLFLKESIRRLIEGQLVETHGPMLLVRDDIAELDAPMSVRSIIAERVDRLPFDTREVLHTASVLGDRFSLGLLAGVQATPLAALQDHLDRLQAANFIARVGAGEFAFVHALFQEVCYATLLKRRRRTLHATAFHSLAADPSRVTPDERFAYHAYHGELWKQAFDYCRLAGARSEARSANREAAAFLDQAARALTQFDPKGHRKADAIDIRLALRSVLIPLLRLDRAGQLLAEAHAIAVQLGDRRRLATIIGLQASHAYLTQTPQACMELCAVALRLAAGRADAALRIAPSVFQGQSLYAFGQFRRAVRIFERTAQLVTLLPQGAKVGLAGAPRIVCGYWIAIASAEIGDFAAAERAVHAMVGSETGLRPFEYAYAEQALGFVLMLKGEIAPALAASQRALEIADDEDIPYMIPSVASQAGLLWAAAGDPARGVTVARRGVDATLRIGVSSGRSRWIARLAEAMLLDGQTEAAAAHATDAVEIARAAGELAYLAAALRLRAKVALAAGAPAAADLKAATAIARSLAIAPFVAKCLVDQAQLDLAAGRRQRALTQLERALRDFCAMGMTSWATRTRAIVQTTGPAAPAANLPAPTPDPPPRELLLQRAR